MEQSTSTNNILQIFPGEIWEIVLDKIDDTWDSLSMLNVFPLLRNLTKGTEFSCFMGLICPLVLPKYVTVTAMKICRLVSKRWRNAVDRFLETRPIREDISSNGNMLTFSHQKFPLVATNFWLFQISYDLQRQSHIGNPFPGRAIDIYVDTVSQLPHEEVSQWEVQSSTFEPSKSSALLKMFGHYVWYVSFLLPPTVFMHDAFDFSRVLIAIFCSLRNLPNLKSLELKGNGSSPYVMTREILDQLSEQINSAQLSFLLVHLKTLQIRLDVQSDDEGIPKEFHFLIMYAFRKHDQLRKLATYSRHWRKNYATWFPNIAEIVLQDFDKKSLRVLLHDFESAPLRNLIIQVDHPIIIDYVLAELHPYKIQSLQLIGETLELQEKKHGRIKIIRKSFATLFSLNSPVDEFPSIRHLHLGIAPNISFSFLNALPSLEYLTLSLNEPVWSEYEWGHSWQIIAHLTKTVDEFRSCLHLLYYMHVDSPSNFHFLWPQLPKLKTLTVLSKRGNYQYDREHPNRKFHSVN